MAISGQITVATAGTAVAGLGKQGRVFVYKGDPNNAGDVYIGNDGGDITSTTGYVLAPGDVVIIESDPGELWFDAANNGDKVCWIRYV